MMTVQNYKCWHVVLECPVTMVTMSGNHGNNNPALLEILPCLVMSDSIFCVRQSAPIACHVV